jgi:beta-1,4-mannosyl-glycoprotein beta-1,4-N-acetylglucosaminyltransferase
MISAVDEIPKPARIRELYQSLDTGVHFLQQLYYLYLNTKFGESSTDWPGTYACPWKLLKTQSSIYDAAIRSRNKIAFVADGGWHFSYTGGPEFIFSKLQSFAHTEWVHMTIQDIQKRFDTLSDPIERSSGMKFQGYDALENMPLTVQNNTHRYSQYLINI